MRIQNLLINVDILGRNMGAKPDVKLGEWITVGSGSGKDAVVCHINTNPELGDIEVVYLDDRDRAINEDVIWKEDHWEFKYSGPCGGYADKYSRLSDYVSKLRRGRY